MSASSSVIVMHVFSEAMFAADIITNWAFTHQVC